MSSEESPTHEKVFESVVELGNLVLVIASTGELVGQFHRPCLPNFKLAAPVFVVPFTKLMSLAESGNLLTRRCPLYLVINQSDPTNEEYEGG